MEQVYISNSPYDTINFAKDFASKLQKGDVVVLTGDLGAGKTKFVEGILTFFGLEDLISSPTFTIVNEYESQFSTIYHFDVYRLASVDEFYEIGGDEYFGNGICLIEWGELFEEVLPKNYIHVFFEKSPDNDDSRIIKIQRMER